MSTAIKTKNVFEFNPDWGKTPATACFCFRCNRDLKPGQSRRWIHLIDGGAAILHPDSEADYVSDGGDMYYFPVGMDCAKIIGLEWSRIET